VELGRPVETLTTNYTTDPFFADTPKRRAWAEWFLSLWQRFQFRHGVHIRRIHYVLVSASDVCDVNGRPYLNNTNSWADLKSASCDARYLGLVAIDAFVDHRTDDAIVHVDYTQGETASLIVNDPDHAQVLSLIAEIPERFVPPVSSDSIALASLPARLPQYAFDPPVVPQRFHIEIWAEKTTVADVLDPLAREYRLNLVMGAGDMSLTRCHEFIERTRRSGRPVRILYVSDFDHQGHNMPVGVARKFEFLNYARNLGLDIRLMPIVLTHEQCIEYRLPRIPIKDTVKGKARFEERFGEGATELDALEALHPGELRRILIGHIERYHDRTIDTRVGEAVAEFTSECNQVRDVVLGRHELESLRHRQRELNERFLAGLEPILGRYSNITSRCNSLLSLVLERYRAEARQLIERYRSDAQEIADEFNTIAAAIVDDMNAEAPDPEDYGWPEPAEGDEVPDPLFDSRRDYVAQIDRYKHHQGKPTARKERTKEIKPRKPYQRKPKTDSADLNGGT
jgi:hypothetical protein